MRALELGSVETLICWENLDIQRYVLKNHANSTSTTVLHLTPEQEKDKSHFTDKEVGICVRFILTKQGLNTSWKNALFFEYLTVFKSLALYKCGVFFLSNFDCFITACYIFF